MVFISRVGLYSNIQIPKKKIWKLFEYHFECSFKALSNFDIEIHEINDLKIDSL